MMVKLKLNYRMNLKLKTMNLKLKIIKLNY